MSHVVEYSSLTPGGVGAGYIAQNAYFIRIDSTSTNCRNFHPCNLADSLAKVELNYWSNREKINLSVPTLFCSNTYSDNVEESNIKESMLGWGLFDGHKNTSSWSILPLLRIIWQKENRRRWIRLEKVTPELSAFGDVSPKQIWHSTNRMFESMVVRTGFNELQGNGCSFLHVLNLRKAEKGPVLRTRSRGSLHLW